MSYTSAIFFVDFEAGSDAARTALTGCVISNPSGSIIQVAKVAHGLVVGAIVDATLFTAWFNSDWKVSVVVDADNFQVEGTWQAAADANGTITPRGGSSKADAWKTWITGATAARIQPGDTIRTMASPDATSLGVTGAWTDGPLAATQAVTSSTNATPIVVTLNSHGYLNGDTVIIDSHATNTNANGTWTVANKTTNTFELQGSVGNGVGVATGTVRKVTNVAVTLSAAVNANIACPRAGETGNRGTKTNWTASANVTCSVLTTSFKQGGESQVIDIAAGFTTGLAAYLPLSVLTDLSAYQQITFWVMQTAGTLGAAGAVRINLCSDTVGAVPVDTFDIPAIVALSRWVPVTVNKGSALTALAQSISFSVVTDNGAQIFRVDNICAVKSVASADSLSLNSLIGKNSAGESWLAIQSILGARVMLDQQPNTVPAATPSRGYTGATETVTTHKREPLLVTMAASQSDPSTAWLNNEGSSTPDVPIVFSFGWDRTAMTSQSGETWASGRNGFGRGLQISSSLVHIDGTYGLVRFEYGCDFLVGGDRKVGNLHANNNITSGYRCQLAAAGVRMLRSGAIKSARNNGSYGIEVQYGGVHTYSELTALHGNGINGALNAADRLTVTVSMSAKNNANYGVVFGLNGGGSGENIIHSLTTAGNGISGVLADTSMPVYLKSAMIDESTEVSFSSVYTDPSVVSESHDGVAGNTQVFKATGRIASETTVRHTASGYAWSLAVTSLVATVLTPIVQKIADVAVGANTLVTVKLWMRRTNTGLTMRLMCKGGQIAGVANDVSASMTAAADTWEQITITCTPTEAGVISITAEAFGGTTHIGYVDDLEVTQA